MKHEAKPLCVACYPVGLNDGWHFLYPQAFFCFFVLYWQAQSHHLVYCFSTSQQPWEEILCTNKYWKRCLVAGLGLRKKQVCMWATWAVCLLFPVAIKWLSWGGQGDTFTRFPAISDQQDTHSCVCFCTWLVEAQYLSRLRLFFNCHGDFHIRFMACKTSKLYSLFAFVLLLILCL